MATVRADDGRVVLVAEVRSVGLDGDDGMPGDRAGLPVPRQDPVEPVPAQQLTLLVVPDPVGVEDLVVDVQVVQRRVVDGGHRVDVRLHQLVGQGSGETDELVVPGVGRGLVVRRLDRLRGHLAEVHPPGHPHRGHRIPTGLGEPASRVGLGSAAEEPRAAGRCRDPLEVVEERGADPRPAVVGEHADLDQRRVQVVARGQDRRAGGDEGSVGVAAQEEQLGVAVPAVRRQDLDHGRGVPRVPRPVDRVGGREHVDHPLGIGRVVDVQRVDVQRDHADQGGVSRPHSASALSDGHRRAPGPTLDAMTTSS